MLTIRSYAAPISEPRLRGSAGTFTRNSVRPPSIEYITDVAYDGSGNLFMNGLYYNQSNALVEMLRGSSGDFENINLNAYLVSSADEPMFWDGRYLALGSVGSPPHIRRQHGQTVVNRLLISGSSATIVGTVNLAQEPKATYPQFWIQGGAVIEPSDLNHSTHLEFFTYPGGKKTKSFFVDKDNDVWGVALSVAPSGTRTHR